MIDPKKLQDALDSAMADNVGGEFRSLITNLIEARSKNRSSESPNEQQSIVIFTNGARLIWETYLKASDIVAGIAKPPVA
jgi:hypothetical protein